jgi:tRNA dimethylallyltransferase
MAQQPLLLAIAGPTAIGKTALAIDLARHYQTEILSFDSRQCYKEMYIGTAKPSLEEQAGIPHHFIHSHSIHETVNAGTFQTYANAYLQEAFKKRPIVIAVGGTGLYLNGLLGALDELPPVSDATNQWVIDQYQQFGLEWLQVQIQNTDPLYAQQVDLQNPVRLIRALSFYKEHQIPLTTFYQKQKLEGSAFHTEIIHLQMERSLLYERINTRVDQMMAHGLLEEVLTLKPFEHLKALQTVGYTELFQYLNGQCELNYAIDKIKQHTRNYAKRQITWFKNKHKCWELPVLDAMDAITKKVVM